MIQRLTPVSHLRLFAVLALLVPLAGCGGGSKYAGSWTRDLYGEGEVQMKLASNGNVELMLPSPRWPDSVDMKGRAQFKGDTLVFPADTSGSACQTADARYAVSRTGEELHVSGLGMDSCGGRRAALVGTWKKS
jgi:hypothetical protein